MVSTSKNTFLSQAGTATGVRYFSRKAEKTAKNAKVAKDIVARFQGLESTFVRSNGTGSDHAGGDKSKVVLDRHQSLGWKMAGAVSGFLTGGLFVPRREVTGVARLGDNGKATFLDATVTKGYDEDGAPELDKMEILTHQDGSKKYTLRNHFGGPPFAVVMEKNGVLTHLNGEELQLPEVKTPEVKDASPKVVTYHQPSRPRSAPDAATAPPRDRAVLSRRD